MAPQSIPSGVRLMAYARTIRYIGWGFGESLIPIFIIGLTHTHAGAGLVTATYDITLLLALPIIGILAERMSARWLVGVGLLIYPFVGIFYFLAGLFGLVLLVVLARTINGVAWAFDVTGVDTYLRRLTPGRSMSESFGYLDTISNLGWMLAALSGIWLVKYFPIHTLLFMIAPFALFALPFVLFARKDHTALSPRARPLPLLHAYRAAVKEWGGWSSDLRLMALLVFFGEAVYILIGFFAPIDIFQKSDNLSYVIVFTVVLTIPALFGYVLGKAADHHDKPRLAAFACAVMGLVLLAFALPLPYALTVGAGLVLGTLIELLSILQKSIATELAAADHYGRLESVFNIVAGTSALAMPPILGAALDLVSFATLSALLSGIAFLMAFMIIMRTHPRRAEKMRVAIPTPERAV